jgi:hypothetical protein
MGRLGLAGTIALVATAVLAVPARAEFGIVPGGQPQGFEVSVADLQAGAPTDARTDFNMNLSAGELDGGQIRDLRVDLPPGTVGNPHGIAGCTSVQLSLAQCPPDSQIGVISIRMILSGSVFPITEETPIFNMVAPSFQVADLGTFIISTVPINIGATVRPGDYGVRVYVRDMPQIFPISGVTMNLWGVPADSSHDTHRVPCLSVAGGKPSGASCPSTAPRVAFLQNGTSCDPAPKTTTITADSWLNPKVFAPRQSATSPALTGCQRLPFQPRLTISPSAAQTGVPTGLSGDLEVPQNANRAGLATAHLKDAAITLPEGMTISAAAADGLGSCSDAQIDLASSEPPACPDSSKVGSLVAETPVLSESMHGSIFLGRQTPSQLLRLFLVVEDHGIVIKIPGRVDLDPRTGQVTAAFDDGPQLPFSTLHLQFKSGSRAALVTPPTCGRKDTTAALASWARPEEPLALTSSFQLTSGPGGSPCSAGLAARPFKPALSAGVVNPVAGGKSPFVLRLSREDGTQQLGSLDLTMPPGLSGSLKGVPYCPETAIAATAGRLGSAELASPSCPPASQVGTVTVGAGPGTSPFFFKAGKAYLAGPYKGAPLSLVSVLPPVTDALDLNTVVVRAAVFVDPTDTHLTVESDPLPQILQGIPIDLRDLRVGIDRPGFIVAPTNCTPMSVAARVTAAGGAVANPSQRFQVGDCAALGFKPKLALSFAGPAHRSAHPKLRAVLTAREGDANISRAAMTLPRTEFLENAHIRTICTRLQYAARQCPEKSIYGYARAWSPLLDRPLQGPVYLRSSDHQLPDLVASLDGQVHVDLVGRIDSVRSRIRDTFEMVPDAPVSRFELTMRGGDRGLLVNNTDLCRARPRARALFHAQNGRIREINPLVKVGCGKKQPSKLVRAVLSNSW